MNSLHTSSIKSLKRLHQGKVRDMYEVDEHHLLIVTTDRISAFDVILPTAIPGKGKILTQLSDFWLHQFHHIVANHSSSINLSEILADAAEREPLLGRSIVVKKFKTLPIEAIVRGYLVGSGWQDYQKHGSVCGIPLPSGLQLAEQLASPIFTPSTKAILGEHDENISADIATNLVGDDIFKQVKQISLQLYKEAAEYALKRGIIIADTKFEFGLGSDGNIVLIDEVLTPDSSRFWPKEEYNLGTNPPSYDKQYVRDYLSSLDWDKKPPGPKLPDYIVSNTVKKYQEALDILSK